MGEYLARVGTSGGEVLERSFVAESEEALRRDLDSKGYYVFAVRAKGASGLSGPFGARRRVPMRQFLVFNHELATLLKAGLPLLQGLELLLERMEHPLLREILRDVRDQIKGGAALSEAFAAYPQHFPPLYATSLRAGERSGELEQVIRRYIAYTQVMEEVRKKVQQAVIYPAFLIATSIITIFVLLTYAIPRFAEMYRGFGSDLPFVTLVLVEVSSLVRAAWPFLLVGGVAAYLTLRVWWRSEAGRLRIDAFKLKVPYLGSIWHKFAVSQLARALSTLLRGGIPLVSALEVATGSVGNRVVSSRVRGVTRNIREGESLSSALDRSGVMQPMVLEMVKVGESTGALAEMLENVATYFDEDIAHDLQRFLTLLEPALLVFMGTVIAVMLIAMYMPIVGLAGAVR